MHIQTRQSVFETNSSSSHSLSLGDPQHIVLPQLTPEEVQSGYVTTYTGEFGWEYEEYDSWRDKLSYLITDIITDMPDADDQRSATEDAINSNPELAIIDDFLFDALGVRLIIGPGEGYIDHESCGTARKVVHNFYDLRNYLFNPQTVVITDNDNH
jgi:hypothetical protein